MKGLLLAAALTLTVGAAVAETLVPGETTVVTSSFCRSAEAPREVMRVYEAEGYTASLPVFTKHLLLGECIRITAEIVPVEVVYEAADRSARIIKVEHPTKKGQFVYMLTMRYKL